MQTLQYKNLFWTSIKSESREYFYNFNFKWESVLFTRWGYYMGEKIYWGSFQSRLKTLKTREYQKIYSLKSKPELLKKNYHDTFWCAKAQIKSKDVPQRFLFGQKELRHKEYELGFEIEVEKAQFKSLSVANEFVVLMPINKKSYIFAFNVFAGQNRAKIYKRVENANI